MISTVTVTTITTISTITTTSTIAAMGMAVALSIAVTITLIAFLTTKELIGVREDGSSQRIGRFLNVGIIPLLLVFAAIVAIAIVEIT